jgi:hypothetical protein
MIKTMLVIVAAMSMLFAHAAGVCRASCVIEASKPKMTECCKGKHGSDSQSKHQEKSTQSKNSCASCFCCKIPPAPSAASFEEKVQFASTNGSVCRVAEDRLISGECELPAIPPPRA